MALIYCTPKAIILISLKQLRRRKKIRKLQLRTYGCDIKTFVDMATDTIHCLRRVLLHSDNIRQFSIK